MTDSVVVRVKPGSHKGPLVEVGPNGELIIYVREPAIDGQGQRCGHPAARSSPSIAKEPSQIGVRSDVAVQAFPSESLSSTCLRKRVQQGRDIETKPR